MGVSLMYAPARSPRKLHQGRAIRCKSSFASFIAGFPLLSLTHVTASFTK
jgi:hypothetical protein